MALLMAACYLMSECYEAILAEQTDNRIGEAQGSLGLW